MNRKVLKINEHYVSTSPLEFICYGLGPCIALFLIDRLCNICGGAHIPLTYESGGESWNKSTRIIESLFKDLADAGSDLKGISAKLTGGANVLNFMTNHGEQNAQCIVDELLKKNVYISASDIGGSIARSARFNGLTGQLKINTSEKRNYTI